MNIVYGWWRTKFREITALESLPESLAELIWIACSRCCVSWRM